MDWENLDRPTRAGFVASVMAVLGVLIPPISLASAAVGIGFSGFAWQRSVRRGDRNNVARSCLFGCLALVVFFVIGNAIYAAGN